MDRRIHKISGDEARAIRNEFARKLYDGELAGLPVIDSHPLGLAAVAAVVGLGDKSSASRAIAAARALAEPVAASAP